MKITIIKTLFIILFITSFLAGGFVVFASRVFAEESGEFQVDPAVSQDQISPLTAPGELSDDSIATDVQPLTEPQSVENTEKGGESALENTDAETLELDVYPEGAAENPIWKINDDGSATTAQDVSMGLIYCYPKNEDVSIKFSSLPEISGTITIREIKLSPEEQEMLGALSDTAYDITSTMENGTFTYDLTLPLPQNANNLDVKVRYAETEEELFKDIGAEHPDEQTQNNITIKNLDHFTIFVVTVDVPPLTGQACIDAGADAEDLCFNSISSAITAASNDDTINIDAGTYQEKLDLGGKTLTIEGAGVDTAIVDASSFAGYAIKNFGDSSIIRGLTLKGTSDSYGFKVSHVSDITLENIKVEDSNRTGVDLNTIDGATLNNIEVINTVAGFGVMILDSNEVVVTDVTTDNNIWGGVSIQTKNSMSASISFNGIFDAKESIPLLLEQNPPDYYGMTNVQIPDKFDYVVYALREADSYKQWFYQETLENAKTLAQELMDSGQTYSGMIINDIAEENYYVIEGMLIQNAINAANPGDTINVAAGTYVQTEDLVIDKQIILIGDSSDPKPTIQFDGICDSLIIQADGAVVNNLRIYKSTTSVDYDQCSDNNVIEMPSHLQPTPPSTVDSGDFTLKNCIVDFGRRGIRVSSSGDVVIRDNEFLNQYRDSIFVANLRGGKITINANTFTNGGDKAITFESGPDTDRLYGTLDIKNNTVDGGNSRGNFIVYNHWADPSLKVDMTIRTNIINQITSNAIAIYYPVDYDKFSNVLIEDNDIYDAGRGIILDYADGGPDITPSNGQIVVENNVLCRFTSSDLTPAIPIYDSGIDSDNKAIGVKGSGPIDTNGFGTINGTYGTAAVAAVNYGCDTTPPTVDAGPDIASSSDITIDGSSALDASGIKSYLWEITVCGPGDVTFSDNTILNPLVSVTIAGAYQFKLTVTDNVGNSASDEMIYTKLSDNQIIASSDTNVTAEQNEIVINCSNNSTAANISIPSSVNDAEIDVSSLINDDGFFATAILPQILISAVTSISSNPVIVSIPAETTITAPTGWDGTINTPTVEENSSVSVPVDSDQAAGVSSVIEIGYGDVKLVFDKAVRVLLPGQAGKYVGYSRNETFVSIDSVCSEDSQSAGDALLPEGDCKIDSDSDLVVWTKHFTQFITYTVSQSSSSGGGGGGSALPPEAYLPPTLPATGFYVLVNDGAAETSSRLVSLLLGGSYNTAYVMISESPEFPDGWQASYLASRAENRASFTLSEDEGIKTVYVRFCTKWSRCSEIVSDSIVYKIKIEPKEPERPLTIEPIRPTGEPIRPTGEEVTDTAKSTIKEITGTAKPRVFHKLLFAFVDKWDFVMRKLWKYGVSKIKPDQEAVFQQAIVTVPLVRQNLLVTSKMVGFILKPLWEIKTFF